MCMFYYNAVSFFPLENENFTLGCYLQSGDKDQA